METVTVLLTILLLLSFVGNAVQWFLLRKAVARIDFFENWIEEFLQRVYIAREELKRIDKSGHFEADDEVGYFFKSLKDIMNRLFEMGIIDEEEIERQKETEDTKKQIEEIDQALRSKRTARIETIKK